MKKLAAPITRLAYTPAEAAASIGVGPDYFNEHIAPELRWVRRRAFVAFPCPSNFRRHATQPERGT